MLQKRSACAPDPERSSDASGTSPLRRTCYAADGRRVRNELESRNPHRTRGFCESAGLSQAPDKTARRSLAQLAYRDNGRGISQLHVPMGCAASAASGISNPGLPCWFGQSGWACWPVICYCLLMCSMVYPPNPKDTTSCFAS